MSAGISARTVVAALLALLKIAAGYVLAVLVSASLTLALLTALAALPDQGRFGSAYGMMRDFGAIFFMALAVTFLYALPGFVLAMIVAWWRRWHGWTAFALMGMADAVLSHLFTGSFLAKEFEFAIAFSLIGGAAGGAAFWYAAGRLVFRGSRQQDRLDPKAA